MRYLLYFVLGPWSGQWTILAFIVAWWFLLSYRLIQPIHGFKLRKIAGILLLASAFTSFAWTIQLGHAPISTKHLEELQQLEKNIPNGESILTRYAIEDLTEMDFFVLKRKIKRATHPHFRRHLA